MSCMWCFLSETRCPRRDEAGELSPLQENFIKTD